MVPPLEAGQTGEHCSYETRVQSPAPLPSNSQPAVIPAVEEGLELRAVVLELGRSHYGQRWPNSPTEAAHYQDTRTG